MFIFCFENVTELEKYIDSFSSKITNNEKYFSYGTESISVLISYKSILKVKIVKICHYFCIRVHSQRTGQEYKALVNGEGSV